ncbi:MAG TPA: hypothetical protein ENK14_00625, partial [Caldithrix sp.]|nr:hypothetical protein [Caldithrix sp.]
MELHGEEQKILGYEYRPPVDRLLSLGMEDQLMGLTGLSEESPFPELKEKVTKERQHQNRAPKNKKSQTQDG